MSAQFCQLKFVVESRTLADPLGQSVTYPLEPGSVIVQWCDPVRAMGWFRNAERLLNDQSLVSQLNAPVNKSDRNANGVQAYAQITYVHSILSSIARGYNLLNLVALNDPVARDTYRRFVAGPPTIDNQGAGDSTVRAVYLEDVDYNPAWYTRDEVFPRGKKRNDAWGYLQTKAVDATARLGGRDGLTKFSVSAMISIAAKDGLRQGQTIEGAEAIYNVPITRMKFSQYCGAARLNAAVDGSAMGFPWSTQCRLNFQTENDSADYVLVALPDGSNLAPGFDDWRAAYLYTGDLNKIQGEAMTAPLIEYMPWISEWVAKILKRTPQQIIQDNRAFTIYQNAMTIARNGSTAQQVLAKIIANPADIQRQKTARSQEATIATGILTTASVAANAVPGYGQLASLILGAAAAVVQVADSVITKGTSGHGRDDLGRYKLQFDRAWLSNDPSAETEQLGVPLLPATELVDPPGEGTAWNAGTLNCDLAGSAGIAGTAGTGTGTGIGNSTGLGDTVKKDHSGLWIAGGGAAAVLFALLLASRGE